MLEQMFNLSHYHYNVHAVPVFLAGFLIFFIGVFILHQTKKILKNVAFFLFCMSLSLWLCPIGFVYSSNNPQTALLIYKYFVFLGVLTMMPNVYLFSAATAGVLHKQRKYVIAGFLVAGILYLLTIMTDHLVSTPKLYFWGYYPRYEPLTALFFISFIILFIRSEINLWIAYKREDIPVKKSHILIIFVGLLIGLLASFDFVPKIWVASLYPFGFIPSLILSTLVAYSIIRHRAFDIETVIHKTILWILSFALVVVPFFFLYLAVYPYIRESFYGHAAFGFFTYIVFAVYLRLFQPKIDHFFQRRRADLEEISSRFAEDLVHLKGFDNLIRRIEETIINALYPSWADIFIFNEKKKNYQVANRKPADNWVSVLDQNDKFLTWLEKNNRIAYSEFIEIDPGYQDIKGAARNYFNRTRAAAAVPLVLNERLLGVINLDKKASLTRYNAADSHFLTTIKNQAAVAISNSLIYQSIEEQVKERTNELLEMQKQLIQAEKLATVGTLSGGVAHEINNPLTAILTNVQMLLSLDGSPEDTKESLELIEEATQRCRTIVQKLMAYAKKPMESEGFSKVNVADVLKKVVNFLTYQLGQDNIKIRVSKKDNHYFVLGNHNELEQVLTNLILNARDAILGLKKSGCVDIILEKNDRGVVIKVKDEGKGIPRDVLPRIFDPFFTTKDVGKGLGLGLSICQSIVEKHKGRITVESWLEQGTVFTVELPVLIGPLFP